MAPSLFPPPWSAEETEACYIVRDTNGQALAYVYFEVEEPGRRAAAPPAHPRRGVAHRREHRQAAAGAEIFTRAGALRDMATTSSAMPTPVCPAIWAC